MLYREIIAVCSEIHTKHINTVSGQNVKEPFCVMNFRTTNKLFFPRLTHEPFSATSRCTVSSSTDCRNPTLPLDDKQYAFWNIAIRWTEVHSSFGAVTVQHSLFALHSIYLSRYHWSTCLSELLAKCQKIAAQPLRHVSIGKCLRYRTTIQNNQQTYLISLGLKSNGLIIQTHATVLMYSTLLTDCPKEHTDRSTLEWMHWAGWGGSTELLRATLSAVLPETVKTLHFDTARTANSEQICDLC